MTTGLTVKYLTTIFIPLADDGSDQTAIIQEQIDAAPDGTPEHPTVIQFPPGRYHTEGDLANNPRGLKGVLHIVNRHHLIFEGAAVDNKTVMYTEAPAVPYNTSIDNNTYSNRRHFWLDKCSNIAVRNIRIEGSNNTAGPSLTPGMPAFWLGGPDKGSKAGYPGYRAPWEFEHAFDITSCDNVLIEDCEGDNIWGDGVYIGGRSVSPSTNITLRRIYTHWTGRQGIALANCRNVTIEACQAIKGRRSGIDLEPYNDEGFVTDVEIFGCTVHPLQTQIAAAGRGDVSRVNIHHNTFNGQGGALVVGDAAGLMRRSDWIYANNVRLAKLGAPAAAFKFTKVDNVTIDGNVVPISANQSRKCVLFNDCQGSLIVTNNDFDDGCYVDAVNSAEVVNEGNIFGTDCPL